MAEIYTNIGPIRGSCGHAHKSMNTAVKCLHRDQHGCKKQGGYSDRRIYVATVGDWAILTDDEGADE